MDLARIHESHRFGRDSRRPQAHTSPPYPAHGWLKQRPPSTHRMTAAEA